MPHRTSNPVRGVLLLKRKTIAAPQPIHDSDSVHRSLVVDNEISYAAVICACGSGLWVLKWVFLYFFVCSGNSECVIWAVTSMIFIYYSANN